MPSIVKWSLSTITYPPNFLFSSIYGTNAIATNQHEIYYSTDGGKTWQQIDYGSLQFYNITSIIVNGNNAIVCDNNYIYSSKIGSSGFNVWTKLTDTNNDYAYNFNCCSIYGKNAIACDSTGNIFYSIDTRKGFSERKKATNKDSDSVSINSCFIFGKNAVVSDCDGKIYYSIDAGKGFNSWSKVSLTPQPNDFLIISIYDKYAIACCTSSGYIFYSTDNGKGFQKWIASEVIKNNTSGFSSCSIFKNNAIACSNNGGIYFVNFTNTNSKWEYNSISQTNHTFSSCAINGNCAIALSQENNLYYSLIKLDGFSGNWNNMNYSQDDSNERNYGSDTVLTGVKNKMTGFSTQGSNIIAFTNDSKMLYSNITQ